MNYIKLFHFSYDVVTTQKYETVYNTTDQFCEIFFYDTTGSEMFRVKITMNIMLSNVGMSFTGTLVHIVECYQNNTLLRSVPITTTVKDVGPIDKYSVLNRNVLLANDFEANIKMKSILSQQFLFLRVRLIGF